MVMIEAVWCVGRSCFLFFWVCRSREKKNQINLIRIEYGFQLWLEEAKNRAEGQTPMKRKEGVSEERRVKLTHAFVTNTHTKTNGFEMKLLLRELHTESTAKHRRAG